MATISSTERPATKDSACSLLDCMPWWFSLPPTRNLTCCQANPARSEVLKYLRAASPLAKWKMDAPIIIVLSTSKNAAAVRSWGTGGGLGASCGSCSVSGLVSGSVVASEAASIATAASAEASPASAASRSRSRLLPRPHHRDTHTASIRRSASGASSQSNERRAGIRGLSDRHGGQSRQERGDAQQRGFLG